jgi:hypothetical protein
MKSRFQCGGMAKRNGDVNDRNKKLEGLVMKRIKREGGLCSYP